ncbi:MAG: GntR family transcriptional regulator [Clostridiales bacterium]|nr:GntR family transcriptional regulator [Clostridiales bacterium]
MLIQFNNEKPIFIQLAEGLEDAILNEAFEEETQIPSTTELSVLYKINPATALKGINMLVDDEILFKKRGIGMFVTAGAKEKILHKRKRSFYDSYILALLTEAEKLGIDRSEIINMIERGYDK